MSLCASCTREVACKLVDYPGKYLVKAHLTYSYTYSNYKRDSTYIDTITVLSGEDPFELTLTKLPNMFYEFNTKLEKSPQTYRTHIYKKNLNGCNTDVICDVYHTHLRVTPDSLFYSFGLATMGGGYGQYLVGKKIK
jgi:hypothetical protein